MTKIYENIIRSDIDKRLVHIRNDFSITCNFDEINNLTITLFKKAKEKSTPDDMYIHIDFLETYNTKVFGVHNLPIKTTEFIASLEDAIRYFIRHVHFHYYVPMYSLIVLIKDISQHVAGDEIQTRFIYSTSTIEKVIFGDTDGS